MDIRRIVIFVLTVVLLAVGITGCKDYWLLNPTARVQITAANTFVVKAEGEDPLDARTQVEQILIDQKYQVITTDDTDANTLSLSIRYEYLPENQLCRGFTFILRNAAGLEVKSGVYGGDAPLTDLLNEFTDFIRNSVFNKL